MKNRLKDLIKHNTSLKNKYKIKAVAGCAEAPFNFIYDFTRYLKYTILKTPYNSKTKSSSMILKEFHRIEKGLALHAPRPGFGKDVVDNLVQLTEAHINKYGADKICQYSIDAIAEYVKFNADHGIYYDASFSPLVADLISEKINSGVTLEAGTFNTTASSLSQKEFFNFKKFFSSRHSVRNFTGRTIGRETLIEAVAIAKKTPSVCNRQSFKVYFIETEQNKAIALSLQNGNRGFGDKASHIAVITSNLASFEGAHERNQAYFDSALFSMSIVLALHSLDVGTCFLNWSTTFSSDRKLHSLLNIPKDEIIGTLIAIGEPSDDLRIPVSPRRDTSEFYEFI